MFRKSKNKDLLERKSKNVACIKKSFFNGNDKGKIVKVGLSRFYFQYQVKVSVLYIIN